MKKFVNYINRLSVGQKVMSLIVVVLVSFSLVTANAVHQIDIVGEEVERMSDFYLPAFSSVQSIRAHILGERHNFQGVINVGEQVVFDKGAKQDYQVFRDRYEDESIAINADITAAKALIVDRSDADRQTGGKFAENFKPVNAMLERIVSANQKHKELANRVFQHVEDGSFLMGKEMLDELDKREETLVHHIDVLLNKLTEIKASSVLYARQVQEDAKSFTIVIAVISIVIGISIIFLVVKRNISRPLYQLTNAIDGFDVFKALYESEDEKALMNRGDELGMVSRSFNKMKKQLIEARQQLISERDSDLADKEALISNAIDNMPGGIMMIDKDLTIQLFNDRYVELYEIPDGLLHIGGSLRDLIEFRAARGDYGPGDVAELVGARVGGYDENSLSIMENKMPSGRVLELIRNPIGDRGLVAICTDITERKLADEMLAEQKAVVEAVLANMDQGVVMYDGDMVVTSFNEQARRYMRFPDDVLFVGAPFKDIDRFAKSRGDPGTGEIDARVEDRWGALAEGRPHTLEYTHSDGAVIEIRRRAVPGGGYVVTQTDITERKNAEEELTRARDDAESAARAKAAFLATMSHEIRTPMNGVVGMIDLLRETSLVDDQREMVNTIRESAFSLLTIINDILDFSKIEAGQLAFEEIPISIRDVVESAAETLSANARKKGIVLRAVVDPDIPDAVLGDQVRVRQILFNLTGNAVKFTDKGKVLLRADLVPNTDQKTETIKFSVVDTGIGIPKAAQKELFSAFTQAESSTTRRYGGTGLGLSISQRLAELMGSDIKVESEPGKGSTFSFTASFPVGPADAIRSDGEDLSDLRILMVVRDSDLREFLPRYLEKWGASVVTVEDIVQTQAVAAEAIASKMAFDIISISSSWSLKEQVATVRTMRAKPEFLHTRYVLAQQSRIATKRPKIDNTLYIDADPLRRSAFIRAMAIAAGRASPDIVIDPADIPPETDDAPTVEEAEAAGQLILMAEDNITNQNVLRRQLHRLGYAVEIVDDGKQALEVMAQKSFAILLTDCHMPNLDGFELTERIRNAEKGTGNRLPVVAITASAMKEEVDRCYAAGMDDFLSKPVEMQKLKDTVRRWMPKPTKVSAVNADAAPPERRDEAPNPAATGGGGGGPIDPTALNSVFGDDDEVIKEILLEFVDPTRNIIEEIETAFADRSSKGVGAAGHKLKSSARAVGATALADLCAELELAGKADDWPQIERLIPDLAPKSKAVIDFIDKL
jgi:signal transduction histidine kinase/DNA-binding response OmpR family regulator/HPt (histidine-containing phosphotransfer) domain-containing protein